MKDPLSVMGLLHKAVARVIEQTGADPSDLVAILSPEDEKKLRKECSLASDNPDDPLWGELPIGVLWGVTLIRSSDGWSPQVLLNPGRGFRKST